MPRDISGNYTLPAGNPVVDGTIIDVLWANPTMADIAVQLNNVLTRDGILGPTAPILFATGSAAAPSIAFSADPALGIYRAGSNILGFSTGGTQRLVIGAAGNITVAAPSSGSLLNFTLTAAVDSQVFSAIGNTTGYTHGEFTNTGGRLRIGVQGSVGSSLLTGASAYATVLGSVTASDLALGTNAIERLRITFQGNITINAPTGGTALTINSAAAAVGAINSISGAVNTDYAINLFTGTVAAGFVAVGNSAVANTALRNAFGVGTSTAHDAVILTNNTERLRVATAGNVTIAVPSSGTAFTVNSASGANAVTLNGLGATDTASLVYQLAGVSKFYATLVGATDQIITGSIQYDMCFRSVNKNILFSTNDGVTAQMKIGSAGNVTISAPTSGPALTLNAGMFFPSATLNTISMNNGGSTFFMGMRATGAAAVNTMEIGSMTDSNTWSNARFSVNSDGRIFGTAIHNNGLAVTGTTNQYIASGTYTPTVANNVNVAAVTAGVGQWIRVGNVVTVSVVVTIDPTAAAPTFTSCSITLPIASNFTNGDQAIGTGDDAGNAGQHGGVRSDLTGDFALYSFTATSGANIAHSVTFTYVIL